MSEGTSAVSGQGAGPTVSATAPVQTGVVSQGASAAPAEQPSAFSWAQGADELTSGYIQNKGWDNPLKAVESYRNLEKLLGADKANNAVVIPRADADAKEWASVYDKLGRPSAPDGYKVQLPEGGDPEFHKATMGKLHELGLTQKQGETLMNWYNESVMQQMQQVETRRAETFNQEEAAVRQECLNAETIDALADTLGHKATMNLLAKIGTRLGEDSFVSGDVNNSFGNAMTPAQAKAQIQSLMSDKDFTTKYMSGNQDAKAKMAQLHSWAYPEG
jgi:hypothetical protein